MTIYQKTILFVCSQGRIRSRTAEVLAVRAGMDARSCGTDADAIVPITDHLIREADIIVCMEDHHAATVREFMHAEDKTIHVLGIEDIYEPFTPRLVAVLMAKIGALLPDVSRAMARAMPVIDAAFVTSDPEIFGGTPVFSGTRVPVAVLFENLADGLSLDEILDSYPTLKREQAIEALCSLASIKGA